MDEQPLIQSSDPHLKAGSCGLAHVGNPDIGCDYPRGHGGRHAWQDPLDYWGPKLQLALSRLADAMDANKRPLGMMGPPIDEWSEPRRD